MMTFADRQTALPWFPVAQKNPAPRVLVARAAGSLVACGCRQARDRGCARCGAANAQHVEGGTPGSGPPGVPSPSRPEDGRVGAELDGAADDELPCGKKRIPPPAAFHSVARPEDAAEIVHWHRCAFRAEASNVKYPVKATAPSSCTG